MRKKIILKNALWNLNPSAKITEEEKQIIKNGGVIGGQLIVFTKRRQNKKAT